MAFPTAKVKKIMKLASSVERISNEAVDLMARSAVQHVRLERRVIFGATLQELFVKELVADAAAHVPSGKRRMLRLRHVEKAIGTRLKYSFIGDGLLTFPCEETLCLGEEEEESNTAGDAETDIVDIEDMLDAKPSSSVSSVNESKIESSINAETSCIEESSSS